MFQTARIAALCGATSIVFHAAFYLNDTPSKVYEQVKKQLQQITSQLRAEGNRVWMRPEVTGKTSQFGTLEEVLELSAEIEMVAPCIDFAHWYARTGKFNSYDEFTFTLKQVERKLGRQALDNMHIHVSGIAYGKSGESKHLNLRESDFNYVEFIHALSDYNVKGLVSAKAPTSRKTPYSYNRPTELPNEGNLKFQFPNSKQTQISKKFKCQKLKAKITGENAKMLWLALQCQNG